MLCRVSVQQLWGVLSSGSLSKSDKSRVNFIGWLFILFDTNNVYFSASQAPFFS
ncbi:hypothetical protein LJPFL01_1209 [Lelliottia jeotgali]|nr:hypothetical protein LJPFL01_1209 [Lelliottia jeotgali]